MYLNDVVSRPQIGVQDIKKELTRPGRKGRGL